jgi:hypothetical protein
MEQGANPAQHHAPRFPGAAGFEVAVSPAPIRVIRFRRMNWLLVGAAQTCQHSPGSGPKACEGKSKVQNRSEAFEPETAVTPSASSVGARGAK